MRPARELALGAVFATALGVVAGAEPAHRSREAASVDGHPIGDQKAPITVTADTLEYDYKANVVVYRGSVQVIQGEVQVKSDTLTVTLTTPEGNAAKEPHDPSARAQRVRDIVAVGNVRIDHGTRWATGGRAVFDQTRRTLVLTEDPVLRDGANEVAGERVVVFLDEDRSVVEGGRRRVKAVLYPGKEDALPDKAAEQAAAGEASTAQAAVP